MMARRCGVGAIALALMLTAGCGIGGDKAGGGGGVTTLQLGTPDPPGRIGSKQAERFAAEVRRRSHGRLRVQIVYEASEQAVGKKPGWDQTTAELVRDGQLQLGMVPARAWDALGVKTLQALQAPFLITSTELVDQVVKSPMGEQMLRGLDHAGVVGLALLPEELRHPIGFGHALRGPADYAGRELRVPRSDASYELMRALGARPVDLDGDDFDRAVADHRIAGAESSLALVATMPRPGTVSANVTFYPKVNTLVVDRDALERLSGKDRELLREAAAATAATSFVSEAETAGAACRQGSRVIAASVADIAALEAAAKPVYARLESDPTTRALIARIRALKARSGVSVVAAGECSPPARRPTAGSGAVAGGDPSVLNGVYRYYLDKDALIRAGVEAGRARLEYGVQTITLRDGQFSATWRSADHRDRCDGSYTVAGARGQLSAPSCGLDFRFRWRKTDDGIRFTDIEIVPPRDTPEERVLQRVIWSSKPWKRIADLPSSRSASIPDGAYRKLVDRAELIRGGLNDEQIADEAGVQTILISKGRYTATTTSGAPACGGRVVGSGQRVTFVQDPGKCGPGRAELLSARWALVDGGLRFTDIETNVLPARVVFGGAPWKKIG